MLNLNEEELKKSIVQNVADQLMDEDQDLSGLVNAEIKKRIDKIFDERVKSQIQAAIDETVNGSFEREYRRVNQWGEQEGPSTTLRKELEKTVTAYWNAKVNAGDGKPSSSDYNSVSRAQWLMTKICAEDFTKHMQTSINAVTGSLKDGLRTQLGVHMDQMLNKVFNITSLQDQGKAEKPW